MPYGKPNLPGINSPMQAQPNLQDLIAMMSQAPQQASPNLFLQQLMNHGTPNLQGDDAQKFGQLMPYNGPAKAPQTMPNDNQIDPESFLRLMRNAAAEKPNAGRPATPQQSEPQTVMEAKDPVDDLMSKIYALMTSTGAPVDTDAMIQEASGGINQAYGAQIGTIRHQNQGARADTNQGTKEIQAMYRALNRDMKKSGRQEARQGKNLAAELQGLGATGAANINKSADQLLTQNAAAADALGSPEIAQQLNSEVNTQSMQQAGNAVNSATRQATNQMGMSGVNRRYFNEAAGAANLEGTNRSSDLIANLQDYLQGNRDKIAEIAGQKAQALVAAKNQILDQVSQDQGDERQQLIDNLMGLLKFRTGAEQWEAEQESRNQPQAQDFSKFFDKGTGNALGLIGMNPTLGEFLQKAGGTPEFKAGYFEDGKQNIPLQGNYFGVQQYLQDIGIADQVDPNMLPALISALMQLAPKSQQPDF